MNTSLTISPSASLALTCSTTRREGNTKPSLHRPGDIIPVNIELHKHRPFEALSLHGSIVGETRVWAHPSDDEDLYQTMIHTHLNQVASFSHLLPMITDTMVGAILDVPLTFVLPELCTENEDTKANSRIPPSCESGSLYVDPWARTYMQPLIEYSLRITLRFRLADEMDIRTISAKHGIRVTTAPHCDPPTYTKNISEAGTATAAVDVRRSRFAKAFATLSAALAEPPPVVGNGVGGKCRTTAQLQLTWETSRDAYDEFELGKKLIKIDYELQARTCFGTRTVDPNGRTSSREGRLHKRVETATLTTFELRSVDREDVRITSVDGRRCHTGSIAIPIQVDDRTIPTFSHGLASRDYMLLVKVQIQGLQHARLSTRVPVQVCESVAETKCSRSRVKEYGDMLSTEVLPGYEDHR